MSCVGNAHVDLGELIRRILVHDRPCTIPHVADALGLSQRSLHARLRGGARFTPDEFAILLRELPDERLARWFLAGTGLLLVRQPAAQHEQGSGELLASLLAGAGECLTMLCDLAAALEGSTGAPHHAELAAHIDCAQSLLLQARASLATPRLRDEGTPTSAATTGFGALVQDVVVQEGHVPPRQLAASLALGYHALHARLLGEAAFAPHEIRHLLQLHPDPRIADYLLAGTPFTAIARPAVNGDLDPRYGPLQMGLLSLHAVLRLMDLLVRAHVPPTDAEVAAVQQQIGVALRQLAALHWRLTQIGHRSPGNCHARQTAAA